MDTEGQLKFGGSRMLYIDFLLHRFVGGPMTCVVQGPTVFAESEASIVNVLCVLYHSSFTMILAGRHY